MKCLLTYEVNMHYNVCVHSIQIIEKRRRDRINTCLMELRRLVPQAFEKQVCCILVAQCMITMWFGKVSCTIFLFISFLSCPLYFECKGSVVKENFALHGLLQGGGGVCHLMACLSLYSSGCV